VWDPVKFLALAFETLPSALPIYEEAAIASGCSKLWAEAVAKRPQPIIDAEEVREAVAEAETEPVVEVEVEVQTLTDDTETADEVEVEAYGCGEVGCGVWWCSGEGVPPLPPTLPITPPLLRRKRA
jgi:hypothetical protein